MKNEAYPIVIQTFVLLGVALIIDTFINISEAKAYSEMMYDTKYERVLEAPKSLPASTPQPTPSPTPVPVDFSNLAEIHSGPAAVYETCVIKKRKHRPYEQVAVCKKQGE